MNNSSLDIKQTKIEKLYEVFPEFVSDEIIDWDRLKHTHYEDIANHKKHFVLNLSGRGAALLTLQTGTTATLAPSKKDSINFDKSDYVFIEDENLETLKELQKASFGKINYIIIDPTNNTRNDPFICPDWISESKVEYMKCAGDKDE